MRVSTVNVNRCAPKVGVLQKSAGRRARDADSRYLLTGFARCGGCGGGLAVVGGSHTSGRPHSYGCLSYHKRGTAICGNGLKLRVDLVDDAVLRAIGGDVLRPAVVGAVLDGVFESLQPDARAAALEQLRAELARVEREMGRLSEAIAIGGDLTSLLDALKARQARQDGLRRTIQVEAGHQKCLNSTGAPWRHRFANAWAAGAVC